MKEFVLGWVLRPSFPEISGGGGTRCSIRLECAAMSCNRRREREDRKGHRSPHQPGFVSEQTASRAGRGRGDPRWRPGTPAEASPRPLSRAGPFPARPLLSRYLPTQRQWNLTPKAPFFIQIEVLQEKIQAVSCRHKASPTKGPPCLPPLPELGLKGLLAKFQPRLTAGGTY